MQKPFYFIFGFFHVLTIPLFVAAFNESDQITRQNEIVSAFTAEPLIFILAIVLSGLVMFLQKAGIFEDEKKSL